MLEKILFILLGMVISSVAYFIKRRIEKKPIADALDRHQKLLAVRKELIEQNLSAEDLHELEAAYLVRASKITDRSLNPLLAIGHPNKITSQAELRLQASNNVDIATATLDGVLKEIRFRLDGQELQALEQSQIAWAEYSIKHSEFAASSYEGGTLYPYVYLSALESLTRERAAVLQIELDDMTQ